MLSSFILVQFHSISFISVQFHFIHLYTNKCNTNGISKKLKPQPKLMLSGLLGSLTYPSSGYYDTSNNGNNFAYYQCDLLDGFLSLSRSLSLSFFLSVSLPSDTSEPTRVQRRRDSIQRPRCLFSLTLPSSFACQYMSISWSLSRSRSICPPLVANPKGELALCYRHSSFARPPTKPIRQPVKRPKAAIFRCDIDAIDNFSQPKNPSRST